MTSSNEQLVPVEREGPAQLPSPDTLHCFGCKHLTTKYWHEELENDETDSGTSARCEALPTEYGGKSISAYWSQKTKVPDWCPFLAAALRTPPAVEPGEGLVERISRAMCECVGTREADDEYGGPHPVGHWLDEGEPWWTGYKELSQAAIESLENIRADEIETLRAQLTEALEARDQFANLYVDRVGQLNVANSELTAATRRAEQAERLLAKENLIERTAISAFLKHEAESRRLSQCTGRVALIAAAYAVAGEQYSDFKTMCIGCDMPIADKEYVVDCNGETGCPSCFTDDGSGECWFNAIRSAASGEQG